MENGAAAHVVCIGGAGVDDKFHLDGSPPAGSTSLCGQVVAGFGGVARNVAENLGRLGVVPVLVTLVGGDDGGNALVRDLERCGLDTRSVVRIPGATTARYMAAIAPDGALVFEIADMTIFERFSDADLVRTRPLIAASAWVFADGNVPAHVTQALASRAHGGSYRLAVDVAAVPKAANFAARLDGIDLLFLNAAEARAYLLAHGAIATDLAECAEAIRARGASAVVVTNGAAGVIVADGDVTAIPASAVERVVDVTGAGDALVAATLARLIAGADLRAAVRTGVRAASLTIQTRTTVRADLSAALIGS
jgi:pseudouridine kinase